MRITLRNCGSQLFWIKQENYSFERQENITMEPSPYFRSVGDAIRELEKIFLNNPDYNALQAGSYSTILFTLSQMPEGTVINLDLP